MSRRLMNLSFSSSQSPCAEQESWRSSFSQHTKKLPFSRASKQMSQTLPDWNCLYLRGALLAEQGLQTTRPQALQWCLLTTNPNSELQAWHIVTRWSGIQTGAESPTQCSSSSANPLSWSIARKVAFRLRNSSIAELSASSHSFRSLRSRARRVQLRTLDVMLNSFWNSSALGTCTCSWLNSIV